MGVGPLVPPNRGVMDLSILQQVIRERNLPFKIGQRTPGLGKPSLKKSVTTVRSDPPSVTKKMM